ncbi:MAG: hypothetical protein ACREA0_03945 [bacterium]
MLNAYFEILASAVTPRGGEILRFIGDGCGSFRTTLRPVRPPL